MTTPSLVTYLLTQNKNFVLNLFYSYSHVLEKMNGISHCLQLSLSHLVLIYVPIKNLSNKNMDHD